jgi:hypothetical protein
MERADPPWAASSRSRRQRSARANRQIGMAMLSTSETAESKLGPYYLIPDWTQ